MRTLVLGITLALASATAASAQDAPLRWWKGNTHTHTLNSDGDSSPGEVAHWYRDHDYDFLCISDHNYVTSIDELQRELDREGLARHKRRLLLIPGEEVTDGLPDAKDPTLHVNALDLRKTLQPQKGASTREVLQRDIDAILAAGAMPSVNHPNYCWAITADDLAALKGLRHFEIYNGHPGVNNFGGGGRPSLEVMWDDLLTRGVRLFGVAVDDTHDLKAWGPRECNPGRGWIVVRARELETKQIRAAIEAGDFYASNGVRLVDVGRKGTDVFVKIENEEGEDFRYATQFVGPGGRVLATGSGLESHYAFTPADRYVRVRVQSSVGECAWSQPFFLEPE
jgi:hypothetical protein